MHDRIQLTRRPRPLILDPPQLRLVRILKHTVTRDVIPLLIVRHVLSHSPEHIPIVDPRGLEQRDEVIGAEVPVRTPVRLVTSGRVLGQDLLA